MTNSIFQDNILYIDIQEPFTKKAEFEEFGYTVFNNIALEIGDYYFQHENGTIIIERKTMSDFDGSMVLDHMFEQAQKMKDWIIENTNKTRLAYIKTIGNTHDYNHYAKVGYKSRVGGMESIQIRYGIPVNNYSYDDENKESNFNWACHKLFRSLKEGKVGQYRALDLFKYKNPDAKLGMDSKTHYINCMRLIPGISKEKASKIVEQLGIISMEELYINLNYEALLTVRGVGPTLARRILILWNVII